MAQYIDKSATKAEIKRYKHKVDERLKIKGRTLEEDLKDSALQNLCGNLLHFIDTLEVKEADLEKEIDNVWNPHFNLGWDDNSLVSINHKSFESIAKHFFELGLKVQKGE